MNKIFKVIYNSSLQQFVVVSELSKSKGKCSTKVDRRSSLSLKSLLVFGALSFSSNAIFAATTANNNGVYLVTSSSETLLGEGVSSTSVNTVGVGLNSVVSAPGGTAIGMNANASLYQGAIAIGTNALAHSTGTENNYNYAPIAIGAEAKAIDNGATVLGANAQARFRSTALGMGTRANSNDATAVGYNANASGSAAVAVGFNAKTNSSDQISIGTEASSSNGQGAIAVGRQTAASGAYATALGAASNASASNALAVGVGAISTKERASAIGAYSKAYAERAFVAGADSTIETTGTRSVAVGSNNVISGENAGAFGSQNTVSGSNTFVLGNNINASHSGAVILGNSSTASGTVAVGDATVQGQNGHSYTYSNTLFQAKPTASGLGSYVSVGSSGAERQIRNVAAGAVSASSTRPNRPLRR